MLKICFFCVRSTGRDSYLCSNRRRNCAPNLTFDQQQHQPWMKAPPRKNHPKKSMLHLMRDEKMTFLLKIIWHMSARRRMFRMRTIRTRLCEFNNRVYVPSCSCDWYLFLRGFPSSCISIWKPFWSHVAVLSTANTREWMEYYHAAAPSLILSDLAIASVHLLLLTLCSGCVLRCSRGPCSACSGSSTRE